MTEWVLTALGDGAIIAAGWGAWQLGAVVSRRSPRDALPPQSAVGRVALCFLCGVGLVGLTVTLAGIAGLAVGTWPITAPVLMVMAGAGLVRVTWWHRADPGRSGRSRIDGAPPRDRPAPSGRSRIDGAPPRDRPARQAGRMARWPALAALVSWTPMALVAARSWTVVNDEYAIWAFKGRSLAASGHVATALFTNAAAYSYANLDYPLLLPGLVAWTDGWTGGPRDGPAHLQVALIAAAFTAVAADVVYRRRGAVTAALSVAVVATMPGMVALSARLYGDVPLAALAGAAAVMAWAWLGSGDRRDLAAAAALAGAAALTKNEGLAFGLAIGVGAVVAAADRRARAEAFAIGATVVGAIAPWRAWVAVHRVQDPVVNGTTLRPGRALANLDRLPRIGVELVRSWPGPPPAVLALGAVVVLVVVVGAGRSRRNGHRADGDGGGTIRERRAWRFPLVVWALSVAALIGTYVVTPLDLVDHLRTSASRVLLFPALVTWLGVLAVAAPGGEPTVRPPARSDRKRSARRRP